MYTQFLTSIPEVDQKILMQLDTQTLFKTCQVNQYANTLCQDEVFWKNKLANDYGQEFIAMKSSVESYQNYYKNLSSEFFFPEELIYGNLDSLLLLQKQGKLNLDLADIQVDGINMEILRVTTNGVEMVRELTKYPIYTFYRKCGQWYFKTNTSLQPVNLQVKQNKSLRSDEALYDLIKRGHIEILERLLNLGFYRCKLHFASSNCRYKRE